MESKENALLTRRAFAGAAAFMIVPRYVLGGKDYIPPSDRITVASIGMGRQGQVVTMNLLARPDVQVVAASRTTSIPERNYLLRQAARLGDSRMQD